MSQCPDSHPHTQSPPPSVGQAMYQFVSDLFPICRSITGDGVRQTLDYIQKHIPTEIHEVPSGTRVFDWVVPDEWNIQDAFILDATGKKIVDFKQNNLHVVGYSTPIDTVLDFDELQLHLHSLEEMPNAIPYITSYYQKCWGFCISHRQRETLQSGKYRVVIDSDIKPGTLTYAELIVAGQSKEEVFLSTYICHPSMANNELSGPAVATFLAKWITSQPRRYTYRIIFIPETIGSLTYLSRNLHQMQNRIIAGFNLSCLGDNRCYSFLPSRKGDTLADRAALNVLTFKHPDFIRYTFLDRGSDERQYCSPGVDLPVTSIMRSKYRTYPEYHTSLDNLDLVTPEGLLGSYETLQACLQLLENNVTYKATCLGEPQLGKYGLYPTVSTRESAHMTRAVRDFLAYADGQADLIEISNIIQIPPWDLYPVIKKLKKAKLIEAVQ